MLFNSFKVVFLEESHQVALANLISNNNWVNNTAASNLWQI